MKKYLLICLVFNLIILSSCNSNDNQNNNNDNDNDNANDKNSSEIVSESPDAENSDKNTTNEIVQIIEDGEYNAFIELSTRNSRNYMKAEFFEYTEEVDEISGAFLQEKTGQVEEIEISAMAIFKKIDWENPTSELIETSYHDFLETFNAFAGATFIVEDGLVIEINELYAP